MSALKFFFYLDLKHVHKYGCAKVSAQSIVFFTTNGHRKCGGRKKKKKVGKPIGDPVRGRDAPINVDMILNLYDSITISHLHSIIHSIVPLCLLQFSTLYFKQESIAFQHRTTSYILKKHPECYVKNNTTGNLLCVYHVYSDLSSNQLKAFYIHVLSLPANMVHPNTCSTKSWKGTTCTTQVHVSATRLQG